MNDCDHTFVIHYGVKVFGRLGTAWVQWSMFEPPHEDREDLPKMIACIDCGEQGYEVPA